MSTRRRLMSYSNTDTDNYIKITFSVSSTTTQTQIISSDFAGYKQIDHITFNTPYDATKYDFATSYQFTVAGTRVGYIHFKPGTTSLINLFSNIAIITEIDLNELDTKYVTSMTGMCMGCTSLVQCLMSNCRADSLTSTINMFNSCNKLKYVDFGSYNSGRFKPTNKLIDVRNMFNFCTSLTTLNMSMFDFSGVTQWGYTWGNCKALVELYISSQLNEGATYTTNMFVNASATGAKLYYNSKYSITPISNVMGSNWTVVVYPYG